MGPYLLQLLVILDDLGLEALDLLHIVALDDADFLPRRLDVGSLSAVLRISSSYSRMVFSKAAMAFLEVSMERAKSSGPGGEARIGGALKTSPVQRHRAKGMLRGMADSRKLLTGRSIAGIGQLDKQALRAFHSPLSS
jgi:hypothetical protein